MYRSSNLHAQLNIKKKYTDDAMLHEISRVLLFF